MQSKSPNARTLRTTQNRLREATATLETLRHQALDPYVLDRVMRAEREAERWTRVAAALDRNVVPVGLMEDPGSIVARVLGAVREDWRGTGLQVNHSFRKFEPQCFDRRVYFEAIRSVADLLLASLERPRALSGTLRSRPNGVAVELIAEGDGLRPRDEDIDICRYLANRAGGDVAISQGEDNRPRVVGRLTLESVAVSQPQRRYIFPSPSLG
ncbi:MAG: hypothetical protein AAGE52_19900 [Myxococcota bacterium]